MKRVVKCQPVIEDVCSDNADESKFYTLETAKGRSPFVLVRANATVNGDREEDQYHWLAIGKAQNRRTGYANFDEAINIALGAEGNVVKEHDSMADAFEYLQDVAEVYGL